jgi:flagellar basal body rod protein FlgC
MGVRASMARADASAARIAGQTSDPAPDLIDQLQAKSAFDANILSLRTANDMQERSIRLWA